MDHLLKMRHALYPDIEVPYLCDDMPYSPPFEAYPSRLGFTIIDLVDPSHSTKPEGEVDRLFQAWFFFGLLQTIFGSLFEPLRFVRDGSAGQRIISTQRLRRMMVYFLEKRPDSYEAKWNKEWRKIQDLLQNVKQIIMEREKNCSTLQIPQSPTQLLVVVLFQFLAKKLSRNDVRNSNNVSTGLVERLMIERGWCRRQVAYLSESLHVECLYMVSRIERSDPQFRHSILCESDCIVNKVDRQTYRTNHACHDDSCNFITADQKKMFFALQNGQLPLIANRDYLGSTEVELLDTEQVGKYVAISHVWSHGLGNPRENSLPKCQLARLTKMVAKLYQNEEGSVPYWIDTLCVPLNPPEARALAILNLRKTYRQADKVLVVDAYLETIDSSTLFVPEIALYIICSTWLTRLWTLQEGALAQSLYFQFADRIVDLAQIENTLRHDKSAEEYGSLLGALINYRHADYNGMDIPPSGLIQFLHASVRNRSTSYGTDEALCLATLAGLHMEDIARFTGEEDRMYNFWRLLKPNPSMMAFWTGPRLKTPGRRWAPATLRGNLDLKLDHRKAFEEESTGQELVITDRGMMLRAPGLVFDTIDLSSLRTGFLVAGTSLDNLVDVFKVSPAIELPPALSNKEKTDVEGPVSHHVALVLKRGKRLKVAEYDDTAIDDHALLVNVEANTQTPILYAGFLLNVSIDPIEEDPQADTRSSSGDLPTIPARLLPDDQQWCLG